MDKRAVTWWQNNFESLLFYLIFDYSYVGIILI
jgi:hypothetical protein